MPSPETSARPVETPRPPFPEQQQQLPGSDQALSPQADHGETSYRGHGRLEGKAALITGGDSGIGKAVAIAFAREGADVLVSYLEAEEADAKDTARWITEAGRKAVLVPGDLSCPDTCAALVARAVEAFGKLDVLVNNAAHQRTFASLEDLTTEELEHTFKVNILAMFHLCKAALPHLRPGASIINTSSREAFTPRPDLLAYATTKGAIATFTKSLAGLLADRPGHPGQRRGPRPRVDAPDPRLHDEGGGEPIRHLHPLGPPGPARGAGPRLRDAGLRRIQLHLQFHLRGHGRQARLLIPAPALPARDDPALGPGEVAEAARHVGADGGHEGGGQVPAEAVVRKEVPHPQEEQLQDHRRAAALGEGRGPAPQVQQEEAQAAGQGAQDRGIQARPAQAEGEATQQHPHGGDVGGAQAHLEEPHHGSIGAAQ